MRALLKHAWEHRVRTAAAFCAVVTVLAALALGMSAWRFERFTQQAEALLASPTGVPVVREWPVSYGGGLYRMHARVYPSELQVAERLRTSVVFSSEPWLRARYVRELVRNQSRTRLVDEIAEQTRAVRARKKLTDDEYLQLLAAVVQDIPYGDVRSEIQLPSEVIAAGKGVCTEKSVLLGALMLHEGYETVLFVLDSHRHVALGVGSDGPAFRDLPYAFVETTYASEIGEYDPRYSGWGPVRRRPQAIEIGGKRRFRGSNVQAAEERATDALQSR